MRWLNCLAVALTTTVVAAAAVQATEVVFEFGPAVERRLVRLEASELRRETGFRDRWSVEASRSPQIWYAFSSSSERLIPDLREYSLQTLAKRMIGHNLEVIGQGSTDNKLIIRINDFYGTAFRLPSFQGGNALVKGEVILIDPKGRVIFSEKRTVRTRKRYDRVSHYEGNGHPYPSFEFIGSFGAMFSVFLYEMMSDAYPQTNVPPPIVLDRNVLTLDKRKNGSKARLKRLARTVRRAPEASEAVFNKTP